MATKHNWSETDKAMLEKKLNVLADDIISGMHRKAVSGSMTPTLGQPFLRLVTRKGEKDVGKAKKR